METSKYQQYRKGDFIGQKYEVHGVLGKGGFGVVYLVYNNETGDAYALKTFKDEYLEDTVVRERFMKESLVWINLDRHPYIVRAHFVDEISGRLFIATEFIAPDDNGLNTLEQYIQRKPPNLEQMLVWAIQFCYGMEYAYSKGIKAHRDIKPSNIMITNNKMIKIADFGLAGILRKDPKNKNHIYSGKPSFEDTQTGAGFGTPTYMAPEQFIDATLCDEQSDIYSFGVMFYQMASGGKLPFTTDNKEHYWDVMYHQHNNSPVLSLNSPVFEMIKRCLEKGKSRRYQGFKQLRNDLEAVLRKTINITIKPPELSELDGWELSNKARNLKNIGHYDEAMCVIEKSMLLDPTNPVSWGTKGNILHKLGRYDDAILCYDRSLAIRKDDPYTWNNKGMSLRGLKRHSEAIVCYDKALQLDKLYYNAWNNKGACLAVMDLFQEAIACYNMALKCNPTLSYAWTNKGVALNELKDYKEALVCFENALKIDPLNISILNYIGALLSKADRFLEAKKVFERILELDDNNGAAWFNLALIYQDAKEYNEAISCFKKAIEIRPEDTFAINSLIKLCLTVKSKRDALNYCDRLIDAEKSFSSLAKKAQLLSFFNEYKQAVDLLNNVLSERPEIDLLWFVLSEIHEMHKNYREALNAAKCCRKALLSQPNHNRQNLADVDRKIEILAKTI